MLQAIQETAAWIKSHTALRPETAIVLGTGLGRLAEEIEIVDAFPYNEIPHFPVSTVEGHSGRLLFGRLGGKEVMALEGRFHYYEGYTMKEVPNPARVLHALAEPASAPSDTSVARLPTTSTSSPSTPCAARTSPTARAFST